MRWNVEIARTSRGNARWRRGAAISTFAVAVLVSGCGGSGEPTYSGALFGNCLEKRGANPEAATQSSEESEFRRQFERLKEEAEREFGSLSAFSGDDQVFGDSTITDFLFLADSEDAEGAAKRLNAALRRDGVESIEAQPSGNLVIVWGGENRSASQKEAIDDCLVQSERDE